MKSDHVDGDSEYAFNVCSAVLSINLFLSSRRIPYLIKQNQDLITTGL